MSKPIIRVGTAGWSIDARNRDASASDGTQLQRYAQRLNAVEINSSFYRHHRVNTYRRWADSVPENFRFAVKIPKTLTHDGALEAKAEVLDQFVSEIQGLGNKLGVLLVQLRPTLAFDASSAKRFFNELQQRLDVSIACEPRHPSWGSQPATHLLAECGVARVAADPSPWPGADKPAGDQTFAYFRWHGTPKIYYSNYEQEQLDSLSQQMALTGKTAMQVWCVFDNTAQGYALDNALAMLAATGSTS